MEGELASDLIVQRGTAHGQGGGSGAPVHDPAASVSSKGSEPFSPLVPTVRGVKTSSGGTRSNAFVTSSLAEVSYSSYRGHQLYLLGV